MKGRSAHRRGVDFQLKAAEKHIGPMADAIQEALK
ncbi:Uncharacterised protein [Serratia proteamaculans]|nr:Uncharacterised protein [Serratia proteamaculans]CAI1673770.1 Uncharacterised protein [Serratia proteamaculans]CAI2444427.1 Uncharacterised protein [Serratia proteamaculans]